MIKTVEKRICDVCKREVQEFVGTLSFKYETSNVSSTLALKYRPNIVSARIVRDDICADCCKKLEKLIRKALEEVSNDNEEK
jgi:hypothetical protein